MTLAHGAAGAMFWQYRPDYLATIIFSARLILKPWIAGVEIVR